MTSAYPTMPSTEDQIASIMMRLGEVERRLDTVKEPPIHPSNASSSPADTAAVRSLLVPAAQGGLKVWDSLDDVVNTPSGDTAVYDDRHQTENDVMKLLSLRRDLSKPEDPPFGIWWTYTVEETLLWPTLMFEGSVNRSLDIIMLGPQSGDESDGEDSDTDMAGEPAERTRRQFSGSPSFAQDTSRSGRRGLDDGTVIPELIDSFLENVHVKNPFLDPLKLRARAANVIENGVGWDAGSCKVVGLILLPCWRVVIYLITRRNSYLLALWGQYRVRGTATICTTTPQRSHHLSAFRWHESTFKQVRSVWDHCMPRHPWRQLIAFSWRACTLCT